MPVTRKISLVALTVAIALFAAACPSHESISKINADPARYRNKEVVVTGTVTDSYGVMGRGAYEIDDGTGKLWVATERGVPSRGSRVGARGKISNGFNFGGRTFGTILEETDRRSSVR
jgi:hypothetical protein